MKRSLHVGIAALLLLLALNVFVSFRTEADLARTQQRIAELQGVRIELAALLAAYVDAETGQRGYLLTGDKTYLEPYHAARAALDRSGMCLQSLLITDRDLADLRARIEVLGARKLDELDATIALRRERGSDAAIEMVRHDEGRAVMDDLRALAVRIDADLVATTKRLLAAAPGARASAAAVYLTTSAVLAAGLLGFYLLTLRNLREREALAAGEVQARKEAETALAAERVAHSEAAHANKLKDEFLAVVSHELRTPLNAILGWTSLLRDGAEDENELHEGLGTIDRNARAQARLVDDLLDVSRIITGKVRLQISEVDLRPIVAAVVDGLRPAAEARGVAVSIGGTAAAAEVLGDPDRLQQVVWNLVSNAIKFTPRRGRVDISLFQVDSSIALEVSDTGQGISAQFLPRIFERFSQADTSTTRGQAGLGLGLAIVRHLVEMHGGKISARSEGEGKGATFHVEIPFVAVRELKHQLAGREKPHAAAPQPSHAAVTSLAGLRVLAVDDQPDTLDVVSRVLSRAGAEVRTAPGVEEAFAVLAAWMPDVLVSDIGMPGRDGYSFIRELRKRPGALGELRAMALTAFARDLDRRQALDAGFNEHLSKPVNAGALVEKIAALSGRTA